MSLKATARRRRGLSRQKPLTEGHLHTKCTCVCKGELPWDVRYPRTLEFHFSSRDLTFTVWGGDAPLLPRFYGRRSYKPTGLACLVQSLGRRFPLSVVHFLHYIQYNSSEPRPMKGVPYTKLGYTLYPLPPFVFRTRHCTKEGAIRFAGCASVITNCGDDCIPSEHLENMTT